MELWLEEKPILTQENYKILIQIFMVLQTLIDLYLSNITKNMFDYFETLENQNDMKKGLIHMQGLYNGLKNAKKIRILLTNSF